ncbi:MATE family efflux transporter [Sneathiella limimaris]|uniref:MATE family efflux transporter n=1 Tax=Sneathiella limimaris TaxID=1964213 RepID=UPI00146CCB8A|nr:MATE family efflux transporter [Sneathiella limimaris]
MATLETDGISPAPSAQSLRMAAILNGSILPMLLKLAAPTMVGFLLLAAVAIAEMWYVGQLGTDALAGFSVIFPLVMLMNMLSNGSIGGVIAATTARALGAGDVRLAHRIVWHAVAIAIIGALLFTLISTFWARDIAAAIGAKGAALDHAEAYAHTAFGGIISLWFFNIFCSLLRGTGDMKTPAVGMIITAFLQITISGALTLGWFGLPALGVAGVGLGLVIAMIAGTLITGLKIWNGSTGISFARPDMTLDKTLIRNLLRVGGLAAINPFLTITTAVLLTALISRFGNAAIAGFGIGARLEFIMIPVVFGIGAALISMIGSNIGAGQIHRAERVGWTGAILAAVSCSVIGVFVYLFPGFWTALYSDSATVLEAANLYLTTVGPAYFFFGLGLSLYFASQGAHAVIWPVLAGVGRLVIAVGIGGYFVRDHGIDFSQLLYFVSGSLCFFGVVPALALALGAWRHANRHI